MDLASLLQDQAAYNHLCKWTIKGCLAWSFVKNAQLCYTYSLSTKSCGCERLSHFSYKKHLKDAQKDAGLAYQTELYFWNFRLSFHWLNISSHESWAWTGLHWTTQQVLLDHASPSCWDGSVGWRQQQLGQKHPAQPLWEHCVASF